MTPGRDAQAALVPPRPLPLERAPTIARSSLRPRWASYTHDCASRSACRHSRRPSPLPAGRGWPPTDNHQIRRPALPPSRNLAPDPVRDVVAVLLWSRTPYETRAETNGADTAPAAPAVAVFWPGQGGGGGIEPARGSIPSTRLEQVCRQRPTAIQTSLSRVDSVVAEPVRTRLNAGG